uniref:Uncharacterized protein n=1 Tax=Timema douglasi TaxID=61478 RepID=A0A7R8VD60_TIMDO|nr:unnamed protein product [Timema douglasi]
MALYHDWGSAIESRLESLQHSYSVNVSLKVSALMVKTMVTSGILMVDYLNNTALKDGGGVPQVGLMGRTRGMLKSRLKSVIDGSNDILTGLSSKLESALSLSTESLSENSSGTRTQVTAQIYYYYYYYYYYCCCYYYYDV